MTNFKKWGAVLELLVAAGLWGFGFIAATWALDTVDAFEITFLRFVIAGLVGLPLVWRVRGFWRISFLPALFLAGTLILQTWGLRYTTATKSGFITTLYVVFVPILEAVINKKRLPWAIWICVAMAFLGTALIVDLGLSAVNFGDVLTFGCALAATGQIYWLGVISGRIGKPFAFNIYQCFWALLLTAPFIHPLRLVTKIGHLGEWPWHAVAGVLMLGLGSTVIAFFLQVRAQARLSATVSSLMFLLESPFALIFSIALLGESLRPLEVVGACLIFVSALTATWLEGRATRTAKVLADDKRVFLKL